MRKRNNNILLSLITGLLILLLVSGCYMTNISGNGKITIKFSTLDSQFGTTKGIKGTTEPTYTVRVYLFADDKLLSLNGTSTFKELELTGSTTTVELTNIPTGPTYYVAVSIGTKESNYFEVKWWGKSETFKVIAGGSISPSITLLSSNFVMNLKGENLKGVVVNETDSNIYTPTAYGLYYGAVPSTLNYKAFSFAQINSISIGKFLDTDNIPVSEPWLNTDKGIVPFRDGSFVTDFSQNMSSKSILSSGGVEATENSIAVFYQRSGGLGGVYIDSTNKNDPATWKWLDIDLSQYVSGQPILDYYNTQNYAYFASKLGAFRLSSDLISNYNGSEVPNFMDEAVFFDKVNIGNQNSILSLSGYSNGTSQYLVMGTKKGAYIGQLDETSDAIIANGTLNGPLEGTENYQINKISVVSNPSVSGAYYIAMLSERDLFIYNSVTQKTTYYPFYSGLPGELTGFAWFNDNGTLKLLISGTEGLASLSLPS